MKRYLILMGVLALSACGAQSAKELTEAPKFQNAATIPVSYQTAYRNLKDFGVRCLSGGYYNGLGGTQNAVNAELYPDGFAELDFMNSSTVSRAEYFMRIELRHQTETSTAMQVFIGTGLGKSYGTKMINVAQGRDNQC
jgi:hypothetical protein